MKRIININIGLLLFLAVCFSSCQKDYGNLNQPTIESYLDNASAAQLNNLVTGTLSGMRITEGLYLDDIGAISREMYRFSGADPRYVTDLLGAAALSNTGFYITNPWAARYRVVKNCNILLQAAGSSSLISDAQRKGYSGFAKTMKAYELLLNLNLTYTNGIRVEVSDPLNLGPIVGYDEALTAIAGLLDDAKTDLGGADVSFPLGSGFAGFSDAAGFTKVNRALAARVAVYRKQWSAALTDLNDSFLDLTGNFYTGVSEVFGTGSGDQLNPAFFVQNSNGEVRLAHPSYAQDIEPGDDRISKATLRNSSASSGGLTSDRDVWVYKSSTAPIPIIRNEELILIYAEANIQLGNFDEAIDAINTIRNGHGLPDYSNSEPNTNDLITEMLNQRRYSLFFEGHRWIDMRRYDRLSELPIDREGDEIWDKMPVPLTEQ
ncbi:MAG TPA: RagB/SusD family nutrient uptake outer membrane protein [Panacibacter sp.]|nr:RagB/SusD family nutrient uptake outer membrane protein [Panacibacter sp.]